MSRAGVVRCRFSHSPVPNRRGGRVYILEAACDWQLVGRDGPITREGGREKRESGVSEELPFSWKLDLVIAASPHVSV